MLYILTASKYYAIHEIFVRRAVLKNIDGISNVVPVLN
jgi:hypothetical protein